MTGNPDRPAASGAPSGTDSESLPGYIISIEGNLLAQQNDRNGCCFRSA